ncbi:MAG: DUF2309 domain-containing protein [Methylococcaceae bacterium]|jgi:hypothetical protein
MVNNLNADALKTQIQQALQQIGHVLPGQAPIMDFVHHNTLHGFQHLTFDEALASYSQLTSISGYLPEGRYREFYHAGRINDADLAAAFSDYGYVQTQANLGIVNGKPLDALTIYRIALIYDLTAISTSHLNWQIQEGHALDALQADLPSAIRQQLLAQPLAAKAIAPRLWQSLLSKLEMECAALHPEDLLDLSIEQAEDWFAQAHECHDGLPVHQQMLKQAELGLENLLSSIGDSISLRGLILALTGIDILDFVRPQLIRICASAMDEGVAAWQLPERGHLGLYGAWRLTAGYDVNPFLYELPDWLGIMAELPEDPLDAIILQLKHLEIAPDKWPAYLQRLALELPGWSGMVNWREQNHNYQSSNDAKPALADYLAIRLTLDRLWLNQICRETWLIEGKMSRLQAYFSKNLSEFMVRECLYQGNLPEYLAHQADALTTLSGSERHDAEQWQVLADLVWTWQHSGLANLDSQKPSANNAGWRLFRLCQHLAIHQHDLDNLSQENLLAWLALLDSFDLNQRNKIWLNAYERHYQTAFFNAVHANHNRGRWLKRNLRPDAQVIFCMDDREEGFRRHLEEFNPAIETLGAAGFFGVAMDYLGLDDSKPAALCPVVVTPEHSVQEVARPGQESAQKQHLRVQHWLNQGRQWLTQGLRRNLVTSFPLINITAPFYLSHLLAKSLIPKHQQDITTVLKYTLAAKVKTQLLYNAAETDIATHTKPGFTDAEQAERVAGFLRNCGLTYGFAELTVLMGHGSASQNNPHLAAYDCGACSGRHGGPNARVFAAMVNRPKIRQLLAERDIIIPADTWFLGAEHNTCNENITWYDLEDMPANHQAAFKKLQTQLRYAQQMSAHERCRRLASAPQKPTPKQALAHIKERAADFSQVRPELGHATNAAAVVGRRAVTQGAFFDRRVFLISYDPTQDPEGLLLEGILLAVGPVGAGINLEYYFSTANNDRLGCGSKITHNVAGFLGVMEGGCSDLRTGLPQQMVEIHEAMRLQLLIEAKTTVLEQIYARQASLRELIGGGWLHLSVKDPDSGEIFVFKPDKGFMLWQAAETAMPICSSSLDCYQGQHQPVAPKLIQQAQLSGA